MKTIGETGLPAGILEQHIAVMGKTGSGKSSMTRSALAEFCCLAESAGTFGTYLSRLRSNGLVVVSGDNVALTELLR